MIDEAIEVIYVILFGIPVFLEFALWAFFEGPQKLAET